MDTFRKIVYEYYKLDGCGCGGPLHILLDDDNYGIGHVRWCMKYCFEGLTDPINSGGYTDKEYILGIMICNEYAKMSLEERSAFDAYINGSDLECTGDCDNCPNDILGELYEFNKENEESKK
jgi:hypothetical protein